MRRPSRGHQIRDAINTAATAQGAALTAALHPGDPRVVVVDGRTVILILGNSALGNTLQDNRPYEIGRDSLDNPLPDGTRLEVPQGVTLVFDAGAMIKLRGANVDVGSSTENVDRSGGGGAGAGYSPPAGVFHLLFRRDVGYRPRAAAYH